jgi:hypothetical protein
MSVKLKRREFITLLGGAAATWPLAARAQQAERMHRIAVLMNNAEDDPEGQARATAFRQGLQALGWIEGKNLRIDWYWTAGRRQPSGANSTLRSNRQRPAMPPQGRNALRRIHARNRLSEAYPERPS